MSPGGYTRYSSYSYDDRLQALVRAVIDTESKSGELGSTRSANITLDASPLEEAERPLIKPIQMFGLLSPPALKETEASFSDALPIIVNLINITRSLGVLESEIKCQRFHEDEPQSKSP
jgi:hypothetical protein